LSRLVRIPRALDLATLSILVIDDQPFFRVLLTEVLKGLGVTNTAVAVDGEDGFTAFTQIRPDVVITDWMMPKLDGIDMTRRIRALSDDNLQKVPVILVTAKSERRQIEFARGSGIDEFILKPISAKSICDRLREVIEKPRPFVKFETYTGPCRRRRAEPIFSGPYRRFDDPFDINDQDDEVLAQGLRSVYAAGSKRILNLVKDLSKSSDNMRPIHAAVSELSSIADDMADIHLQRVCALLLGFVATMSKTGKSSPALIQTHMKAMEILQATPACQTKTRDELVKGLESIMKSAAAA
jgi:CheY-like chemotaxis protein